jgi:xylulokinase
MLLGLDVGTSSAKVLLLDENGATVAEAGAAYGIDRPRPGWAETDPERWWAAIVEAVRALPRERRAAVRGVGLTGQMHGAVLCDAAGVPVRPAILWLDTRSAECLALYPEGAEHTTGNAVSAGMTGPLLLWLERHEPGALRGARWALQAKDWVRLRLTGEARAEPSDASGTLLADRDGRWADALIERLGIRRELLAPQVSSWREAGRLSAAAAAALDLPAGVPVAAGGGDTMAAALGSGLHDPAAAQLAIGSSAQVLVLRDAWPGFSPRLNVYHSVGPEGLPRWCLMAAMLNGGQALDWARGALRLEWDEAFARAFSAEAAACDAVFLPYLTGERTPWMDPHLRAGWMGIAAGDDAGGLMRAALCGVAFGIRAGLDALREQGAAPARLRLAGGGTVHPGWRQLLSDALGLPLDAVSCPNAAARGAALLGGLAAGTIAPGDLAALAPAVTAAAEPRDGGALEARYARFLDLRARLGDWFRRGGG